MLDKGGVAHRLARPIDEPRQPLSAHCPATKSSAWSLLLQATVVQHDWPSPPEVKGHQADPPDWQPLSSNCQSPSSQVPCEL